MANTLITISRISFIVAIIFIILAIILWFIFKIPKVMSELSGRAAKKSIAKMRIENDKTGTKIRKPQDKKKKKQTFENKNEIIRMETGLLNENHAVTLKSQETSKLNDNITTDINETELLEVGELNVKDEKPSIKIKMIHEVMCIHTQEDI